MALKKVMTLVGVPTLLVTLAHMNSLPLAYTIRSWWLLRTLVERAKKVNLEPEGELYKKDTKIKGGIHSKTKDLFTTVSQELRCMWDDIDYNQHMVRHSTKSKYLCVCVHC